MITEPTTFDPGQRVDEQPTAEPADALASTAADREWRVGQSRAESRRRDEPCGCGVRRAMSAMAKEKPGAEYGRDGHLPGQRPFGFRARSAHGKFRHAQRHPHAPGTRPLHLRLGSPAARRLHDQAGHRPRGLRRGLLRHVRLGQGSRPQADPPQPRRRAARGHAVHEPQVPEPAGHLRPQEQRRGRQLRRHGVRRRPQPGQRPEAVSRRGCRRTRSGTGSRGWSRGSPTCTTTASSTATSSRPTCSWRRGSSRSATTAWPS